MVVEAVRREIPRVLAEQFRYRPKDATLHHHPTVKIVVAVKSRKPLDRKPKQDDALLLGEHLPPLHPPPSSGAGRHPGNFEVDIGKLIRPELAKILCG